jgi:hypothetical protein
MLLFIELLLSSCSQPSGKHMMNEKVLLNIVTYQGLWLKPVAGVCQ